MVELINEYWHRLDADNTDDNQYSCLLFALQLPSICSRIEKEIGIVEYVDRKSDNELYRLWLLEHRDLFSAYFNELSYNDALWKKFYDSIYNLRCMMVHEGVLWKITNTVPKSSECTLYLIKGSGYLMTDECIFISLRVFCSCLFKAALETVKDLRLMDCSGKTSYETMFFQTMCMAISAL